ncbi:SGNH hydrolase [Glarea lozoyensis ATCC 20868]|uniref:SGNH hydrolase n=1 Tax=Glarea lozoyensis (strain ATCC 20868 / MF5171) TaxID=1116229 RepID=S3D719_GLAL2|nr:SGNH hydrolase [Glarea lozoyensis ATCC 20868]EPE34272.1 SGNH hydrolase [Glarea lozoyensis ATCC 20868]
MFGLKLVSILSAILGLSSLATSQKTVRINALGDSITGSPGCWRAILWQKLQAAGVKNTDFVGTLSGQGCGFSYDGENDGHGGFLATGIVRDNQLPGWLSQSKPDIVMLELGTNDVWSNIAPATIIAAFDTLVNQMRAQKSTMRVLVAQITPMNPSSCSDCGQRVIAFNAAIRAWAPNKSTAASPITVVDCWTGINTTSDTIDRVHPNSSGNTKLANCWYEPLKAAIALAGCP